LVGNPPYPAKIANYFIEGLDFQAPGFKKAQFTRLNTACFVYRHLSKLA
jgi:hypothetical protein